MSEFIIENLTARFKAIQDNLKPDIHFLPLDVSSVHTIAGIDVAYHTEGSKEYGFCSIVVLDEKLNVVEKVSNMCEVTTPYLPGYLAFRELPVIYNTIPLLGDYLPDVLFFDGNGYLHPNNMGIATQASFYLNRPCVGIAKNYLRIDGATFTMPENTVGSTTEIKVNDTVLGLAMRSKKDCRPIFVSCGNYITLDNCKELVLKLLSKESRVPIPTRLADIETRKLRREYTYRKK